MFPRIHHYPCPPVRNLGCRVSSHVSLSSSLLLSTRVRLRLLCIRPCFLVFITTPALPCATEIAVYPAVFPCLHHCSCLPVRNLVAVYPAVFPCLHHCSCLPVRDKSCRVSGRVSSSPSRPRPDLSFLFAVTSDDIKLLTISWKNMRQYKFETGVPKGGVEAIGIVRIAQLLP